jgi:putative ABC transport system permease protein
VQTVGIGNNGAGGGSENDAENVVLPGVPGEGPSLRQIDVGPGFFPAYGPRLLAGRLFDDAHGTDDATDWSKRHVGRNVVINRKALAVLGFHSAREAVGRTLGGNRPITIIGVIDQLRFFSPRQADDPTYYVYYREVQSNLVASIRFSGDPRAMLGKVRAGWQQLAPTVPFTGDTADRRLAKFYEDDDRATRLFGMGAGLAVLIGCVGLWGLASFNTARRVKEIGIRKVLGPPPLTLSGCWWGNSCARSCWPICWHGRWPMGRCGHGWPGSMTGSRSPLYFIGASLLSVAIAVLTVIGQSLRASRAAPSWALRHE